MTLRARLYDARGSDRDIDLATEPLGEVSDRRLLWVDLDRRDEADIALVGRALELQPRILRQLSEDGRQARILRFPDKIVVTLQALEAENEKLVRRELDVVVGRNLVVTVHDGELSAIRAFEEELSEEESLGTLDAGAFMTGLIDAVLASYFREIDEIDRRIEALDSLALQARESSRYLSTVVAVRRRIAVVRRALTPNRDALMPLVRPDFEVHAEVARAWPGTIDRLQAAIDAIEKSRELLVGSFDIYLGRAAQRSNDVMKALTILSAILLPAIVLAGVMGMNFQIPFFEEPDNFWLVLAAMALFSGALLLVARWRHWI
jgi:magnesium/cobalt transport protein CorA